MGLIAFAIGAIVIMKANQAMDNDNDPATWGWLLGGTAVLCILGSLLL